MKLVYLSTARIPTEKAHGIQIMKMCEAFSKNGVTVELIVPKRLNPIKKDPFQYYGMKESFKLTRLSTLDMVGVIPRIGTYIHYVSFLCFAKIYMLKKRYDVLFTRDVAALFLFKGIYLELHSLPKNIGVLYKKLIQRAKNIFTITSSLKNMLEQKTGIKSNALHDGVDLDMFQNAPSKKEARDTIGIPENDKVVMCNSSYQAWKGLHTLARAANALPQFTFIFVGGSKDDITSFKKKHVIKNNSIFVPHVAYSKIPAYLSASDVVVLPNSGRSKFSTHFTSPLKLFEYMAIQKPIVASDLPTIREVLTDKEAYFFTPDDHNHLSKVIVDAFSQADESQKKAESAYTIVQKYSWNARASSILSTMKQNI